MIARIRGTQDARCIPVEFGRIDFISSYCDRWCERCAKTARCSVFAVEAAVAMCGNAKEGLELALGTPYPDGNESTPSAVRPWLEELENVTLTPEESADFDRREQARESRVARSQILILAQDSAARAAEWLTVRAESALPAPDDVLGEALAIVEHDAFLIQAKVHRALDGRDRHREEGDGDDPIQNDWNGSAKVALISLERSSAAWLLIADATSDEAPATLARDLHRLMLDLEAEFTDARRFVRPGFDEPGR